MNKVFYQCRTTIIPFEDFNSLRESIIRDCLEDYEEFLNILSNYMLENELNAPLSEEFFALSEEEKRLYISEAVDFAIHRAGWHPITVSTNPIFFP